MALYVGCKKVFQQKEIPQQLLVLLPVVAAVAALPQKSKIIPAAIHLLAMAQFAANLKSKIMFNWLQ